MLRVFRTVLAGRDTIAARSSSLLLRHAGEKSVKKSPMGNRQFTLIMGKLITLFLR